MVWARALLREQLLHLMPVALDVVFERMDGAVVVLDQDNRVVDLNPSASRLFGCERSAAVGRSLSTVTVELATEIAGFAEKETRAHVSLAGRFFDLWISSLADPQGNPVGRLLVLHDVTEQMHLIQELDSYAQVVAHDLKNPLGVILGYCEIIADSSELTEQTRESLAALARTSRKMTNIVNELLLLASIRTIEQAPIERLDMASIVREACERLDPMIKQTSAQIHTPEEWLAALGHAQWVEEIWMNYLSNALKYGGSPPQIQLGATQGSDSVVRFWVRDNGHGLTQEEQNRLFKEFTRLDHIRAEGHGLGLSVVRRIAEKLSGSVGVDSTVGKGSTFWFVLPAA